MFGRKRSEPAVVRIENPFLIVTRDADPNGAVTVRIDAAQVASGHEAGLILADLAKHLARALVASGKASGETAALADIRMMFKAEMDAPTQTVEGGLVQ